MGPYYRNSSRAWGELIYSGELLLWLGAAALIYLLFKYGIPYLQHLQRKHRAGSEKLTSTERNERE